MYHNLAIFSIDVIGSIRAVADVDHFQVATQSVLQSQEQFP